MIQKLRITTTALTFFLIAGCSTGQDSLILLNESWNKLKTQLKRRNDIALTLTADLNRFDSSDRTSVEKLRSEVIASNEFLDSTIDLDSLTVQSVKQKTRTSINLLSEAFKLRMKQSESTNEFRNFQMELEAAENRINAAKKKFNELSTKYQRKDLLFD